MAECCQSDFRLDDRSDPGHYSVKPLVIDNTAKICHSGGLGCGCRSQLLGRARSSGHVAPLAALFATCSGRSCVCRSDPGHSRQLPETSLSQAACCQKLPTQPRNMALPRTVKSCASDGAAKSCGPCLKGSSCVCRVIPEMRRGLSVRCPLFAGGLQPAY